MTVVFPFLSEEDNLSESSSESLLWSDEEYGQDIDVTTNPDEELDGDDRYDFEVVRCICEVQEENDFMIQVGRTPGRTGIEKHNWSSEGILRYYSLRQAKIMSQVRSPR